MRPSLRRSASLAATLLLVFANPASAQQRSDHFVLTSPDLEAGGAMPVKHVGNIMGCPGQNVSPALQWSGAPAGTQSYVVTMYDPDAPTGSGFWHWVVYNIPATATSLREGAGDPKANALPAGTIQGNTDLAAPGYIGPCPPAGDKPHRYLITVHALKTAKLELPVNATAAMVGFNVHANELGKATLTVHYGR
jgi:Raf kinase inhibitor-like YbhB/YbcL family protein